MMNLRQFQITFITNYFQLVKMISEPKNDQHLHLFGKYQDIIFFHNLKIICIPKTHDLKRMQCKEAIVICRLYRFLVSNLIYIVYMNLFMFMIENSFYFIYLKNPNQAKTKTKIK